MNAAKSITRARATEISSKMESLKKLPKGDLERMAKASRRVVSVKGASKQDLVCLILSNHFGRSELSAFDANNITA